MYLPVSTPTPSHRTTELEAWSSELWDSALMATELAPLRPLPGFLAQRGSAGSADFYKT